MSELSGQVAIVTGGASGIGAASVGAARPGRRDRDLDRHPAGAGGAGRFVQHDVTSEAAWKALLADVLGERGPARHPGQQCRCLRRLGHHRNDDRRAMAPGRGDQFRGRVPRLQVRDRGHEGDGAGQARSKGSIVNVSSIAALIGSAGPAAYSASKGAVRLLSKSVALYCAEKKYGIRCNSVHPGGVDTPIFNPLWQAMGREKGKEMIGSHHPIGRMAEPEDIGEMILWLASDRSRFVTGAEFTADGGVTSGLMRRSAVAS